MKAIHWVQVGLWAVVGGATSAAQFDPNIATICHGLSATAASILTWIGLISPAIGAKGQS